MRAIGREIGEDGSMNQTLKTELKLFLAEAAIQIFGHKHEGSVFKIFRLDTRQRNIIRERRKLTSKLWHQVIRRYPYCLKCLSTENLQVDHIRSLYDWGKTEWGNLQTLCGRCNRRKGVSFADYRKKI